MQNNERAVALDILEQRILETLGRIQQADLNPYDNLDISTLFQKIATQRQQVMTLLSGMTENLDRVAGLLHSLTEVTEKSPQDESRGQIADDFTAGARAIEMAMSTLEKATRDLAYLQYSVL